MSDISSDVTEAPRQVRSFAWFVRRGLIDIGIAVAALTSSQFCLLFQLQRTRQRLDYIGFCLFVGRPLAVSLS